MLQNKNAQTWRVVPHKGLIRIYTRVTIMENDLDFQ